MSITSERLCNLHNQLPEALGPNFCIAPFQSIKQHEYEMNSCCSNGVGKWSHGNSDVYEDWNNAELNRIRKQFIDGQRPVECSVCWSAEESNKESLRQFHLIQSPDAFNNFIKSGVWVGGPRIAVFKTSNICNLSCRKCSAKDSNALIDEGQYYVSQYQAVNNHLIPTVPPGDTNFKNYINIADNFEKISFLGGEALLNHTHLDLLEHLIKKNLSKKIELIYSTNCTIIPSEKFKKIWDHFKQINIIMNVDGINDKFEYLSWPGKWKETVKTITEISNLRNQLDCEVFTMAKCDVNLLNVYYIEETQAWITSQIGKFYINLPNNPAYLSLHIAPYHVKSAICQQTQNPEVLNYINTNAHNQLLWKQFIIWTKRQDLYRKENFKTTFPEFYNIIKSDWDSITDLTETNFLTKD